MAKRKMVILPYSVYDVSAMECWLEEMARKGLHLDVLAGWYGWFEKGEPAETRYRMEPWAGDVPKVDDEMEAVYGAAGWEYVQKVVDEHFHIWRSVRPDARELHDDPIVRSFGFDWAVKRTAVRMILMGVVFLVLTGMIVGRAWYEAVQPWTNPWVTSERSFGQRMMLNLLKYAYTMVMIVWFSIWMWMDFTSARRVRTTLRGGLPLKRRETVIPYRRVVFWGVWLLYLLVLVATLWLCA